MKKKEKSCIKVQVNRKTASKISVHIMLGIPICGDVAGIYYKRG